MEPVPHNILAQYNDILKQRNVSPVFHADYRKWLRYFLDFRAKYPLPESKADQMRLFADKLRSKNQSGNQVQQAESAISLFFGFQPGAATPSSKGAKVAESRMPYEAPEMVCEPPGGLRFQPRMRRGRRYDEWRCLRKTESPAWDACIEKIAGEIKLRHYSRETLRHYAGWIRKFQNFLKDKDPAQLSPQDVKAYLTHLAVTEKVSSSHQNLAFNSLLFLFRHVLNKDFGTHKDIPRAKTSNYIPTVLSRKEIDSVLVHLHYPVKLIEQLQYGCGLRLSEGV